MIHLHVLLDVYKSCAGREALVLARRCGVTVERQLNVENKTDAAPGSTSPS
jgi:hypothetical protein